MPACIPSRFSHDFLDIAVKVVAVTIGGAWTLMTYMKGRTFHKRLELEITGALTRFPEVILISGQCRLKNVGLSRVLISQNGTNLSCHAAYLATRTSGRQLIREEEVKVVPLFVNQGWVEPSEPIVDSFEVVIPQTSDLLLGVKVRVLVSDNTKTWPAVNFIQFAPDTKSDVAKT